MDSYRFKHHSNVLQPEARLTEYLHTHSTCMYNVCIYVYIYEKASFTENWRAYVHVSMVEKMVWWQLTHLMSAAPGFSLWYWEALSSPSLSRARSTLQNPCNTHTPYIKCHICTCMYWYRHRNTNCDSAI